MLEVFQLHLWRPVPSVFCVSLLFFLQLRLCSQSTENYCRRSTFVCTGQRLVHARVVLWSTPGLASMKHFAVFSSDTTYSRGVFFHLGYSFFFRHVSLQPEPTLDFMKQTKFILPIRRRIKNKKQKPKQKNATAARLIRTCDTCAHTYILYVYIMIQLQHYSSVELHVMGTQVEIQYTAVCVCTYACARTRYILYILCNDKQQQQ